MGRELRSRSRGRLRRPDEITPSSRRRCRACCSRSERRASAVGEQWYLESGSLHLYLRGRFLLQRRGAGVRQSITNFAQAIAKDSGFARAHAAYALALELLPYFERFNPDSLGRLAIPAARRALDADSTIAEAHTALAMAYQHLYEWRRAEESYLRAIAAEPPDADAHIQYGRFLFYTRTVVQALPQFQRARELDPNSAVASGWVGHMLDLSGRHDEALAELRRALQIDSAVPPTLIMMAQAHLHAGRTDSARLYAERLWRVWPNWREARRPFWPSSAIATALWQPCAKLNSATRWACRDLCRARDSTLWFEKHEQATAARTIGPHTLRSANGLDSCAAALDSPPSSGQLAR